MRCIAAAKWAAQSVAKAVRSSANASANASSSDGSREKGKGKDKDYLSDPYVELHMQRDLPNYEAMATQVLCTIRV